MLLFHQIDIAIGLLEIRDVRTNLTYNLGASYSPTPITYPNRTETNKFTGHFKIYTSVDNRYVLGCYILKRLGINPAVGVTLNLYDLQRVRNLYFLASATGITTKMAIGKILS